MSDSFAHLHLHTEFSMLDGAARIKEVVAKAAADGQPAIGITDHGNMYGVLDFYKAARKAGITPVIGIEAYMAHEHRGERIPRRGGGHDEDRASDGEPKNYYHLTLLAEDNRGYANLVRLSSLAFLSGFYYKPRMDWDLLAEHSQGIIATTGCLGGHVLSALKAGRVDEATAHAARLQDIFGRDNLFVELQDHGIADQHRTNPMLVELARRIDAPLLATNDCHYTESADHVAHDALLCVQTGAVMSDPDRFKFEGDGQHYLKTAAEMRRLFAELPEACDNTLRIAERANVEIEFGKPQLPRFPLPEGHADDAAYLRHLTYEGARQRWGAGLTPDIVKRLDYELGVIGSMGFDAYFLIVWDLIRYAREREIRVGPGRGSAAGCAVAYCLCITDLDPIRYDLLFERFLNPSRVSMPDIDMDFDSRYRDEMIRYAADRYGRDRVAQIVTFSTIKARAAVRDAARVLGQPYGVGDRIAKAMPKLLMGRDTPLAACLELTPGSEGGFALAADLRTMYASDPDAKQVIDTAKGLEGLRRQHGIHAAAVVITREPLTDYLPIQRNPAPGQDPDQAPIVTQYEGHGVEDLGLLKMDFLGLRTLDVISETIRLVRESRGVEVDIDNVDLNDEDTLAMLRRTETVGIFQLESSPMRDLMRRLAPTSFDDVAALVALYRPGPMAANMHIDYADRKNGRKQITYLHPDLAESLGETQGLMIYQEAMMRVAQKFAGYSLAEADNLRKAAGKKIKELMAAEREKFIAGCVKTGYGAKIGTQLFDIIEPFADYAFNKCAAASTRVILADGTRVRLSEAYKLQPAEVMSMWPDGEVRPHAVQRIVRTGRKPLLQVRTASGRQIRATAEHRLLTTEGYCRIDEMRVGTELITLPKITDKQRAARSVTMRRINARPERKDQERRAATRMARYQALRPADEKIAHMKRMHEMYPDMTRAAVAAMHDRVKWLHANDPEWRQRFIQASIASSRACYDTGPGFGFCSIASNGMWCASRPERAMCEWLIEQDIEFEMHRVLPSGRICDFYFAGIYWEMDGMDRTASFFAEKYGDLPHVVVTPEDFERVVAHHLNLVHAENGDPIISIEPCSSEVTYDIEMRADGPLNYIANGIVSHNSHSYGYGYVAFQTAYLKAHYPTEYLAALLTSVSSDKDKSTVYLAEARRMKVQVFTPDVNRSVGDFSVVVDETDPRGAIAFGLAGIRNVGEGVAAMIVAERERGGQFEDFYDFCERVDPTALNKRALEALIKAGAFDSMGHPRRGLLMAFEAIVDHAVARRREAEAGIVSLFEAAPETSFDERTPIPALQFDKREQLAFEKEMLGVYVSDHPLAGHDERLRQASSHLIGELEDAAEEDRLVLVGIASSVTRKYTKKGDLMMVFTLEDLTGEIEVTLFPKHTALYGHLLINDTVVMVEGRLGDKDDNPKVLADVIKEFATGPPPRPPEVVHALPPILTPAKAARPAPAATAAAPPLPAPTAPAPATEPVAVPVAPPTSIRPAVAAACSEVQVLLGDGAVTELLMATLKRVLRRHPGTAPVVLRLGANAIRLPPQWAVEPGPTLAAEIQVILGGENRVVLPNHDRRERVSAP